MFSTRVQLSPQFSSLFKKFVVVEIALTSKRITYKGKLLNMI